MGFGYLSAAIIALIVLLALKKYAQDRALWRRVKRNLPQAGAAGGRFFGFPRRRRGPRRAKERRALLRGARGGEGGGGFLAA